MDVGRPERLWHLVPRLGLFTPLVLLSIPCAVGIHTVAAFPTWTWVSTGVCSFGFLRFTLMAKVATPIIPGEFHASRSGGAEARPG